MADYSAPFSVTEKRKLFVLSRRNFLFVENDLGGERAATLMTLLENATLRGLDAEGYLTWALSNVLRMPRRSFCPGRPKSPNPSN